MIRVAYRMFAGKYVKDAAEKRVRTQSAVNLKRKVVSALESHFGRTFVTEFNRVKGVKFGEYFWKALEQGPPELGKAWKTISTNILTLVAKAAKQDDFLRKRLLENDPLEEVKEFLKLRYREKWESALGLAKLTDLRMPQHWFSKARELTRNVHYHWGPTNSGKTYAALERLKAAEVGIYCGPLRLLAAEIAEKLNSAGVKCNLETGQERVLIPGAKHTACTIEMADLNRYYDVALIDEIQMISDPDRGSAWTNALLGLPAGEIHLTGDGRAKEIVRKLLEETEDVLELKEYKRLSELTMVPVVEELADLKAGDCVVAFSRKMCHRLKTLVEPHFPCSIIYGNLPPETRRQQAKKFNSREDAQVLIATDAIGMGLNYNISRVIFYETEKNDGEKVRDLTQYEVKQIAGRAGRYMEPGFVSSASLEGWNLVQKALEFKGDGKGLKHAALFPAFEQIEAFALDLRLQENRPVSYTEILQKFSDLVNLDGKYFFQRITDVCFLANKIQHVSLPLKDVFTFCHAPVRIRVASSVAALVQFAEQFKAEGKVRVTTVNRLKDRLERLEHQYFGTLHIVLELYLWLAKKYYNMGIFIEEKEAREEMITCCEKIEKELDQKPLEKFKPKGRGRYTRYRR